MDSLVDTVVEEQLRREVALTPPTLSIAPGSGAAPPGAESGQQVRGRVLSVCSGVCSGWVRSNRTLRGRAYCVFTFGSLFFFSDRQVEHNQ